MKDRGTSSEIALRSGKIVVAAGVYSEILSIDAPSTAMAGSRVDVTVRVKNIDPTYYHWVACVAIYDGSAHFIDQDAFLAPKETYPFSGHFTMPNKKITITAYSYYSYYGEWIPDDERSKDVKLAAYPSADIKDLEVVITALEYPTADIKNLVVVITGGIVYPSADIKDLAVVITALEYPTADIKDLAVVITALEYPTADIKNLVVVITAIEYPPADIKDLAVVITGGLPPGAELFRKLEVTYKKI